MSYQVKKRRVKDDVSYSCTFANSYSLAGCVAVDLILVYSASLISSLFFMASNYLFMSFSIFSTRLSDRFYRLQKTNWFALYRLLSHYT